MNGTKFKRMIVTSMLLSMFTAQADGDCVPSPTFSPRSQGSNTVLKLVGMVGKTHLYDQHCLWGTFALTPLYQQTFRSHHITDCIFGNSVLSGVSNCTQTTDCSPCSSEGNSILIQGSQVANRNANAWLADYFYLPTDFSSSISFSPRIKNVVLNADFYLGLDEWMCGAYFRVYGPFTWTKWELNFCESVCSSGTNSYTAGYFASMDITRSNLLTDFAAYANGDTLGTAMNSLSGVTFNGLQFARINNCDQSRSGFADLWLELGWDFLNCEDYHLGVGILGAVPTGNKRRACRLFDPVIGNGHHWQLGGVFTGHYVFWRSCDADKSFGFYFDANVTHLFAAREERTYDLCGKPNSRYMLAERLSQNTPNNLSGSQVAGITGLSLTPAIAQFANEFTPVANLTTFDSQVKVSVQGDVTALFNFTGCNISWDFGYNFWGRGCEQIICTPCNTACNVPNLCDALQENSWALKGDGRVFGFAGNADTSATIAVNQAVPLSATQSCATINRGTNATAAATTNVVNPALQNQGVDNPQFAVAGLGVNRARLIHTVGQPSINTNQIKTSIQPLFLECDDIDFRGTKGISHKVFTHLNYTFDCECWMPYLGIGGSAEFGTSCDNNNNCSTGCSVNGACNSPCASCTSCALSQWAVWIKGGISFN